MMAIHDLYNLLNRDSFFEREYYPSPLDIIVEQEELELFRGIVGKFNFKRKDASFVYINEKKELLGIILKEKGLE